MWIQDSENVLNIETKSLKMRHLAIHCRQFKTKILSIVTNQKSLRKPKPRLVVYFLQLLPQKGEVKQGLIERKNNSMRIGRKIF